MNYHKVKDPVAYYLALSNRPRPAKFASRFKGVSKNGDCVSWRVQVYKRGKKILVGVFSNEIEAALAYNKAALSIIGPHAVLNVITEEAPLRKAEEEKQAVEELAAAERLYPADWSTVRRTLESLP
jgi:hypothetical protein